ncbi:MAG TPA: hypothetical protein VF847_03115, partial [Candidatus Deferrimicrobiaceae bacterium]
RVVDHEEVAGAKEGGQRGEHPVADLARFPGEGHQPCVASPGRGALGDETLREVVIEQFRPQGDSLAIRTPG